MKPKLTLRDLFWLVLVVAICCAWWWDREELQANARVEGLKTHDGWQLKQTKLIQDYQQKILKLTTERDEARLELKFLRQAKEASR